jgi:hypothetical protein
VRIASFMSWRYFKHSKSAGCLIQSVSACSKCDFSYRKST